MFHSKDAAAFHRRFDSYPSMFQASNIMNSDRLAESDNEIGIQELKKGINKNRELLNNQIKQTGQLFKEVFNLIDAQKNDITNTLDKKIEEALLKFKV